MFDFIRPAHQEFAVAIAREFNQAQVERIEDELRQGQQILEAQERFRRKEFSQWKQALSATAAEIRKRVKLVTTFGDFPLEKIVAIASATNIYALCAPKFLELVEKLREMPVRAASLIKQMVKEARPSRKPKQQQESSVEWHTDVSGGGRHLSINLYDDELALATRIKQDAEKEQITPQHAIAIAFKRSDKLEQVQQQYTEAIAEVREVQIEIQKEIIHQRNQLQQKDKRIEQIESQLNALKAEDTVSLDKVDEKPQPRGQEFSNTNDQIGSWEEFAVSVSCDRPTLLKTVKNWSAEEKQHLVALLAEHIETNYPEVLEEFNWIPDKLRDAALEKGSFAVQQIVGSNNLVDEPELKTFYHCKFVSLCDFGARQERWLFQTKDGKQLPVFGREEFSIERF